MKHILILGMPGCWNLGDALIAEATEMMVRTYLTDKHIDYEVKTIDFTNGTELGAERKKTLSTRRWLKENTPIGPLLSCARNILLKIENKERIDRIITKDTIAIIFAGGGIIKYKYQKFFLYIDEVTRVADKKGIPVLFSAVGIESFDELDYKCRIIKEAINRRCVKAISTRDDINTLKTKYCISNKTVKIAKVADPVCAIGELTGIKSDKTSQTVGIGVGRLQLFQDNGRDIPPEELIQIWELIIRRIEAEGLPWVVFCNGLPDDYDAEMLLMERVKDLPGVTERFLPRPTDSNELLAIVAGCRYTCVCRLHASIVSYALEVPTMGFVWNTKQTMFAETIKREHYFLDEDVLHDHKQVIDRLLAMVHDQSKVERDRAYLASTDLFLRGFLDEWLTI